MTQSILRIVTLSFFFDIIGPMIHRKIWHKYKIKEISISWVTISFLSSDLDNPETPRFTRERRISYKRTKRLKKVCLISYNECSVRGISCVKMFSGRGKLTCAIYRKKGIPCVSFSYGSVERAMDKTEINLKDAQERQQQLLRQLLAVQLEVQRYEREIELAKKRGEEQF